MVFAAVRTHFPTRVYRNTVTCVTRVTSNRVEVHRLNWQRLAMVRTSNIADLVPSGISVYNHGLCSGPNTFPQEKHQTHIVLFYRYVHINHRFQTVYLFTSRLSQLVYTRMLFEI